MTLHGKVPTEAEGRSPYPELSAELLSLAERMGDEEREELVEAGARALYRASGFPAEAYDADGTPRGMLRSHVRAVLAALLPGERDAR